jgi:cell division protein FtsQ
MSKGLGFFLYLAQMKKLRPYLYFIASAVIGLGVLLALSLQTGLFEVRSIPIEIVSSDAHEVSSALSQELQKKLASDIGTFEKHKIWEIDLGHLNGTITSEGWVKSVRITRLLPNSIHVQVAPKMPVLLFVSAQGRVMPVTDDASLLPSLGGLLPDAPLLRGEEFAGNVELRKKAIAFVRSLPTQGPLSPAHIAELSYNADQGYSLLLLPSKVVIKMGEDRVAIKAERVTQVLNYLNSKNLQVRVIDASFSKKVLVRLRKDP